MVADEQPQPPPAEAISINFRDQYNNEVTFKLKGSTKLGKAFDAFSARVEREPGQLRFLFDGTRLNAEDTVESHGIENGDTVDVFMEQIGGSFPVTEDVDQEWVLVSSEDDEASAKRLQQENEALKDRVSSLELDPLRKKVTNAAYILNANKQRSIRIQLHFFNQRNGRTTCEMSNTSKLCKAFQAYADKVHLPAESVLFSWNGIVVDGQMTPYEIGMKDDDRVDCIY